MALRPDPRRRRVLVGLAALAVALAAHGSFWYGTREHPARAGSDVPAAVCASAALPLSLWLPYPHQNLGVLARATGDPATWAGSVARLLGGSAPKIPRFGPFRAPPSRAICLASDAEGKRVVAVARVYPTIAVLARLAGLVASNPWLAGGDVKLGGRAARAGWQGTLWWVATDPVLAPGGAPPPSPEPAAEPALLRLRTTAEQPYLPAGTYALVRRGDGLELAGGVVPEIAWPDLGTPPPSLLAASSGTTAAFEQGGYLLWSGEGELALPEIAAFRAPSARGWKLPGGGAAGLLGGVRDRATPSGLAVSALDAGSAARAQVAVGALAPYLDPARPGSPAFALRVDLAATARELHRLNAALGAIPLLSRRETERWADAERALDPLVRARTLDLVVVASPPGARLRLGSPGAN